MPEILKKKRKIIFHVDKFSMFRKFSLKFIDEAKSYYSGFDFSNFDVLVICLKFHNLSIFTVGSVGAYLLTNCAY